MFFFIAQLLYTCPLAIVPADTYTSTKTSLITVTSHHLEYLRLTFVFAAEPHAFRHRSHLW